MKFTNAQLADAINQVAPKYFVNRSDIETPKPSLTNRVLERLFENLVKDVRAGKPQGTTFTTIAKLASAFNSVSTSMNKIPERLAKRLSKPETTLIDSVPLEFRFSGPREPGMSEEEPLRKNERLYISARYRILPDAAAVKPAAREATSVPSDLIHVQRSRSLISRSSRLIFAVLLLLSIASVPTVLILRQRHDATERKAQNKVEVRRLLDEASDALGGHPGTVLVDDPPGYDRARADQWEVARRKTEQAAILDPTNTRAANVMGMYYKLTGDLTRAAAFFNKSILLEPTNEEPLSNLADILSLQGKMDVALDYYHRAIAVKPDYAPAYIGEAGVYLHRCCSQPLHAPIGDILGIKDDIQFGLALDERTPEFVLQVENYQRDLEAARNAALNAVRYAPHNADAYRMLGNVLDDSRDAAGAATAYQNALRIAPDDPYVRYDYGVAFLHSRNYPDAITQFVRAIKINRNYAKAFAGLSIALGFSRKDVLATAAFLEANRLAPDNETVATVRKHFALKPELVSVAKANAHAFDDDLAAYLVHELDPQGIQQPAAETATKTSP